MILKRSLLLSTVLAMMVVTLTSSVFAVRAESFDQAKALSAQQKKPILMEFVHED